MNRPPHPRDFFKLTEGCLTISLGVCALVYFRKTDQQTAALWAMVDLLGFRRAGFIGGTP